MNTNDTSNTNAHTPGYRAVVRNQYGCPIGDAIDATREEAIRRAHAAADLTLRNANRNWKWRKARTTVEPWECVGVL